MFKPSGGQAIASHNQFKRGAFSRRLSLWVTAIITLVGLALIGLMYYQLVIQQSKQIQTSLANYQQELQHQAQNLSQQEFTDYAQQLPVYIAWQHQGQTLGNLSYMPTDAPLLPITHELAIFSGGVERVITLTGGLFHSNKGNIYIATRSDPLHDLIERFYQAALIALIIAITIGWWSSQSLAKYLLKRLQMFNHSAIAIEQGNSQALLPISLAKDELDLLAFQFNQVVIALRENIKQQQGITDNIAHDLRTPLSQLRNRLEDIQLKAPDALVKDIEQAQTRLDFCIETFDSMLSLTRLEQGLTLLNMQTISVNELCQDLVEMFAPIAELKQQSIMLDEHTHLEVAADRALLFQAISNLVDNAIKYSPDHSNIQIAIYSDKLIIQDNGPGIAKEQLARVFERMVRLDSARQIQGTGLGLSMVKAILSSHNATITLSSNKIGLCASITFNHVRHY